MTEHQAKKHQMKQWSRALKGENSWTMFKVISEFVAGFRNAECSGALRIYLSALPAQNQITLPTKWR
jgi:hypothetical protein